MSTFIFVVLVLTMLETVGYVIHLMLGKERVISAKPLAINIVLNSALMFWGAWLLGAAQ